METETFSKEDTLVLLARRLRNALDDNLARLVVLHEDPTDAGSMRYPITIVAVLRDVHCADEVTSLVVDVNMETDFAYPAFAYVLSETDFEEGTSLKARVARNGSTYGC